MAPAGAAPERRSGSGLVSAGVAARAICVLAVLCACVDGKRTAEEWKTRSIYHVLTDRFAKDEADPNPCTVLDKYCGGTFNGLRAHLDYIQTLGFNAIWISPVVENTPDGYHGYWAKSLFEINPEYGTRDELKALVREAHEKDIWVMVDVVANHMGYVPVGSDGNLDFSSLDPFNRPEHYNDCNGCDEFCSISDFNNDEQVEHCRLAGLPDLNQDNPWVRQQLISWISYLVNEFDFDGIRIDTIPEVEKAFWAEFTAAAGCFAMGEHFDGRVEKVAYYQRDGVESLLAYPMYFTLRDVFHDQKTMTLIPYRRGMEQAEFLDTTVLGLFVDNHDNPRFRHVQKDKALYRNALAYVLMGEGIPVVYYASEYGYEGGADPQNRESLWQLGFATDERFDILQFIAVLNRHRQAQEIWKFEQQEVHVQDNCFVFLRGDTLVVLTNVGSNAGRDQRCEFANPDVIAPFSKFTSVYPERTRVEIALDDGKMSFVLAGGEPQVYVKF